MRLATLKPQYVRQKQGSWQRDGQLVLVDSQYQRAMVLPEIAHTLQQLLDSWDELAPQVKLKSNELEKGNSKDSFPLKMNELHSPLPRAYAWMDGSAYLNHVALVRKARGAEMPASFKTDPLMYQGGSDAFLAPDEDIVMESEEWGIDFESEVAVVTGDVPMGIRPEQVSPYIRLIMLVNDVSLRNLIPAELEKGFGFFQSKPSSSFAPIALTPDALGSHWRDGRVQLPLTTQLNGSVFGSPHAGPEMHFSFFELVAHAAKTRPLRAGSIIGSGTVSNEDRSKGSSCLAEKRMIEKIESGTIKTPFMRFGDRVRIEMLDQGRSLFGAIDQKVARYQKR